MAGITAEGCLRGLRTYGDGRTTGTGSSSSSASTATNPFGTKIKAGNIPDTTPGITIELPAQQIGDAYEKCGKKTTAEEEKKQLEDEIKALEALRGTQNIIEVRLMAEIEKKQNILKAYNEIMKPEQAKSTEVLQAKQVLLEHLDKIKDTKYSYMYAAAYDVYCFKLEQYDACKKAADEELVKAYEDKFAKREITQKDLADMKKLVDTISDTGIKVRLNNIIAEQQNLASMYHNIVALFIDSNNNKNEWQGCLAGIPRLDKDGKKNWENSEKYPFTEKIDFLKAALTYYKGTGLNGSWDRSGNQYSISAVQIEQALKQVEFMKKNGLNTFKTTSAKTEFEDKLVVCDDGDDEQLKRIKKLSDADIIQLVKEYKDNLNIGANHWWGSKNLVEWLYNNIDDDKSIAYLSARLAKIKQQAGKTLTRKEEKALELLDADGTLLESFSEQHFYSQSDFEKYIADFANDMKVKNIQLPQ